MRLFHEWTVVKGSFSHAASRWFSRNNPFKSNIKGSKAEVDFHSLRHTVATELKCAGVASQYAAIELIIKYRINYYHCNSFDNHTYLVFLLCCL